MAQCRKLLSNSTLKSYGGRWWWRRSLPQPISQLTKGMLRNVEIQHRGRFKNIGDSLAWELFKFLHTCSLMRTSSVAWTFSSHQSLAFLSARISSEIVLCCKPSAVILEVTCSPWNLRFAGSNPAEVDWFFQDVKILSTSPPGETLDRGSRV